tara:strand:- start:5254 stop:7272 length:2019 start_codon:yes stop_codon:yes gene_type:complete
MLLATSALAPSRPPTDLDFAHDVLPLLQRAGCASAYCHGSATGRAGFRLSLFGSDAAADYQAITTQFGGRRIDLRQPERSLILQKALGNKAHGGGRRLDADSDGYAQLRGWIAAGAPWQGEQPRELAGLRLDVVADRVVATATFRTNASNGGRQDWTRDVSHVALYSTSDPSVVDVSTDGQIRWQGPGLSHVVARFANRTAVVRLLRPFSAAAPDSSRSESGHALTRAWRAHLRELGLTSGQAISPSELARRLHLDLVGRPPTPQELDEFVAASQTANEQREAIEACVQRLTQRREFAEAWGVRLAQWFELYPTEQRGPQAEAAARWRMALVESLAKGQSLLTIARRLVLGELKRDDQAEHRFGAAMVDRFADARDRAEYAGRTLLGKRIGCARCHDHPSDRWRQAEHLAFSACFAPPRADGAGGMMAGMLFDAATGDEVTPRFLALTERSAVVPTEGNRRAELVQFLLGTEHDAFAKNASNRVFAQVFGRALVEPVDEHRAGNPALDEGMLDVLVSQFHECEGRLPEMLSFLMTCDAYLAPSTQTTPAAITHLAAQPSRALSTDSFVRALTAVIGHQPRAALPDMALARELALRNGPMLRELLAESGTTIDATFEFCATPQARLVELWRTVLSRQPRAEELARFEPLATDLPAFRDLAFALLTGREFGHRR